MKTRQFNRKKAITALLGMPFIAAAGLGLFATSASAVDFVHDDDVIVEGNVCSSDANACADGENFIPPSFNSTEAELKVKDNFPGIWFNATNSGDNDWGLIVPAADLFEIRDLTAGTTPIRINAGAPTDRLRVAVVGVGIGTAIPAEELEILSTVPAIRLNDSTSASYDVDIQLRDLEFSIEGNTGLDIFEMDIRAPEHALRVRRSGDVGIGIGWAEADLHVRGEGSDSTEELLRLESAVPPRMKFENSSTAKNWTVGMNAWNALILSLNGTGKTEARFAPNGNLVIAGNLTENSDRDSKTAVSSVDNRKILDAVADLPISTWEYKDGEGIKHLGPMAQDFHAAFGLGDDPKGISSIDTGGVALAAIKGLNESLQEVVASNQSKDKEIASLKERLTMLENLVNKLTAKEVAMNQ